MSIPIQGHRLYYVIIKLADGESILAYSTRDRGLADNKADALRAQAASSHGLWLEDRYISSSRVDDIIILTAEAV